MVGGALARFLLDSTVGDCTGVPVPKACGPCFRGTCLWNNMFLRKACRYVIPKPECDRYQLQRAKIWLPDREGKANWHVICSQWGDDGVALDLQIH